MEIRRDIHLDRIRTRMHNGMIKIITGMRRAGKSYLLFRLFYNYLRASGVADDHIVKVDLEDRRNAALRDPDALLAYIDSRLGDDGSMHYVLLDEVQLVPQFEDVLNSYLKIANADVYVTGSNARFLSRDIATEFRGRGDEIRIMPLSFAEFMATRAGRNKEDMLYEYMTYGGLPQVVLMDDATMKGEYLSNLFTQTYLRDIKERYSIRKDYDLEELINVLASCIGTMTNPARIENTFKSVKHSTITRETIKAYIDLLQDAFLVCKAQRYDIKGRKYIGTPAKYYFEDMGLRNARLNFRQTEYTHLLENVVYNELRLRGFAVDVGQMPVVQTADGTGKRQRKMLEVDFVCNKGYRRYYIQTALSLHSEEKKSQETLSLRKIGDGFSKVLIVGMPTPRYQNADGITIMSIYDFLLNADSLDAI